MSSVDSQVGKVGNIGILLLSGLLNGFSFLSGPNLRLEVPSYKFFRGLSLGGILSRKSSIFSPLGVCDSVLEVPGRLINLPVSGGF